MRARLSPTLPLSEDETAISFTSRLARLNHIPSARTFCTDLGLNFQGIVDNDPAALAELASLAGVSQEALIKDALRREGDVWSLNGERIPKTSLRRERIFVCPHCLRDDIASSSLPADIAIYGRTRWQIAHLRTCPTHNVALAEAANKEKTSEGHDFALLVGPRVQSLTEGGNWLHQRAPSPLETYLDNRLNGDKIDDAWLDTLDLCVAARLCEIVGAVAIRGRRPKLADMTDSDWWAAGDAGYKVAVGSISAFRSFLTQLHETFPDRKNNSGPQAEFGEIYHWLAFGARDPGHDPVRDILRQHIIETTPVGPGDTVLGVKVERRVLHSIHTAAIAFDAHPKRLRKILETSGVIVGAQLEGTDDRVLFDAAKAQAIFDSGAITGVPLRDIESYLNAGRVHARLLVKHGFITPAPGTDGESSNAVFAKATLDAFLERLAANAVPMSTPPQNAVSIPQAAKRANCSAMEIVKLILDKQLSWIGSLSDEKGYLAVLVDFHEIRDRTRGPALDGMTAEQIRIDMKTTIRVVNALIVGGHLTKRTVINPLNRCPVSIVARSDYERFRSEYATLFDLSRELGRHHLKLKAEFMVQGIKPSLNAKIFFASFYLRSEIEKLTVNQIEISRIIRKI